MKPLGIKKPFKRIERTVEIAQLLERPVELITPEGFSILRDR